MEVLYFLVSLFSSTIGAISGIGGGVIIKPVLDATGTMSVSTISFLSGCTVLSMSIVSLFNSRNSGVKLELKKSTFQAIGAALGGIVGKGIFDRAKTLFGNENKLGATQAGVLLLLTLAVLIYMKKKDSITPYNIQNLLVCFVIGLVLGLISAFLGIGGGPINIAVLYFFFYMDSKTAAINSLFIIFFSQITSLVSILIKGNVPDFSWLILLLMISGGILGGIIGSMISRKINTHIVEKVFTTLLFIIIGINIFNIYHFLSIF